MDRDDKRSHDDPDAPPSEEEIAEAGALRRALEDPRRESAAADFARAVSLAHAPKSLAKEEHREIVEKAAVRGEARRRPGRRGWTGGVVAVAGALALAAGVALMVGRAPSESVLPASTAAEPLAPVRSTQPLFHQPFARAGGRARGSIGSRRRGRPTCEATASPRGG